MRFKSIIFVFFLAFPFTISAQQAEPADTTETLDSAVVQDSLKPGSPILEELTESQRKLVDIQRRQKQFKDSRKSLPRLSYYDSLVTYLASERFNQRTLIDQSYYHDAGDYFKFDLTYLVFDYQVTPSRKIVQPAGLTGDRLNLIVNNYVYQPFEHIVEPDGLVDMNDIPTALDGSIYIIPGPAGHFFGGKASMATLLTVPPSADSSRAVSTFLADKGFFGYDYARGSYSREFSSQKKIALSVGCRDSDGIAFGRDDDHCHYTANLFFPLSDNIGLNAAGQIYDRDAALAVRPEIGGTLLLRHRFDRSFRMLFDFQNSDHTSRNQIGYTHRRQGSYIDFAYKGRFNLTGHGALLSHERVNGSRFFRAESKIDFIEYDNGFGQRQRTNATAFLTLASLNQSHKWSLRGGSEYSNDFDFLPSATALYQFESAKFFVQLSGTYTEREPSLHQLYLPFQQVDIYGSLNKEYSEQGNSDLNKEKQIVGSLTIEPGTVDNNITLSVTGGSIKDAIEWLAEDITGTTNVLHFSPVNDDLTFLAASLNPSLRIADFLRFNAGAAYYYFDYKTPGERPYRPEYNLFSGLELHYYWADRLIHLSAYGELLYTGPYDGYDKQGLGEEIVTNAKLSIGMKNFRFHFVFQNTFDNAYETRENLTLPGRFFYYGITWHFFD